MVQIYIPGNEDFTHNGDAVLMPTACDVSAELNGTWSLNLDHPIDKSGRWKLITEQAVLKVPTWQDEEQLYRIARVTKTEDGVSATAYPIFYDSAKDCFLLDCRPTGKTGQQALDIMTEGTAYSGSSNISTGNTAYFVRRNLLSAIMGTESPTFLDRWGGEVLFNNFSVIINDRVGGDYGAEARYGLNIEGSQYTVDTSELVTRICPVSYNGHMMTGNYVDSTHIRDYPVVHTKEIRYEHIKLASDLTGDAMDEEIICADQSELDAALLAAARAEFAAGCDLPKVSMEIDMVAISGQKLKMTEALSDTVDEEITDTLDDEIFTVFYESYKTLENIHLGDTVHCRHYRLDITSNARVVAMVWDCIRKRVKNLTLGAYEESYVKRMSGLADRINSAIRADGSVVADQIQGFVDGSKAQLRAQYNIAERQDVLALLFENLDSTSQMYGALGIGTQGISISDTRTADGQAWDWTTAITAQGINAGVGVFGILADAVGRNYINLDTGALHIGDSTNYMTYDPTTGNLDVRVSSFSLAGNSIADIAESIAEDAVDGIRVGSRNLLSFRDVVGESCTATKSGYEITAELNQAYSAIRIPLDCIEKDTEYLLSYKFAKTAGQMQTFCMIVSGAAIVSMELDGTAVENPTSPATIPDTTDEHVVNAVIKRTADSNSSVYIQANRGVATSVTLKAWDIQIEDGTIYTDWNPSPEDVDADAAARVSALDNALDQQAVFNRLTNNQANQGIYLENGNLYINGSMIKAQSIEATSLHVTDLATISADLGAITAGSLNIGNGAFVVTPQGALTATSGTFGGTISAGTYLGLPNTGMTVTASGGLQGSPTAGYTGSVLSGSAIGALPVTTTGISYTSAGSTMTFDTSGLSMGSGFSIGVDGRGEISNIVVDTNAIYSTGHTWYGSTTRGFYLGADGSFGVGDGSSNFMHFDATNGRLDIKVTSFSLTSGDTIDSIAQGKADTALNSAKNYTDTAIQNIPAHSYTQQQIYNMLVNNVPANQGIYLENGMLKINADAIAVGTMAVARLGALQLSAISADLGTITAGSINISGTGTGAGTMTLSNGVLSATNAVIDGTIAGHNASFDGTFTVGNVGQTQDAVFNCGIDCGNISAGNVSGTTFSCSTLNVTNISGTHFTSPWTIQGMSTVSTNTAMFNIPPNSSVGTIAYGSASSIRYKDVIRNLTSEDVEKAYGIQPVIAKYKDGYLVETDERVGMAYPMFVAEDVEKYLPTVATHRDGLTENWDERAMIPVMFQMIKDLKKELEVLRNGKV